MKNDRRSMVMINGYGYRIRSWMSHDIVDFAPRATTPSGSISYSELGLLQPSAQISFVHGFGFSWNTDAEGYAYTEGLIDTRHDGVVTLMTSPVQSDNNNATKTGVVVFKGMLFSWGSDGVRRYSGGTWAVVNTGTAGAVNFMWSNGQYVFACPSGARIVKSSTGGLTTGDWSAAGANANSINYQWLSSCLGYCYAGQAANAQVFRACANDLSDLYGALADDPNMITVGSGTIPTIGAISFAGALYISRQDALYSINASNMAQKSLDYSDQISALNFSSMCSYQGMLYFPIRDRIYRWNGSSLADVTPNRITDTWPFTTYGLFKSLCVSGKFMFVIARTNEATYRESILCYDGTSWHKLVDTLADGVSTTTMLAYDVQNNYLWYHVQGASTNVTYYIPFQAQSEFPYGAFPTTGVNRLYTSRYDMGFPWVYKSASSVVIEADNLNQYQYISVYYSIDNIGYVKWGDITQNGYTALTMPSGNQSFEFHWVQLAFELHTSIAAQTPVLKSATLKFIMRPTVAYGYTFDVPVACHITSGDGGNMEDWRDSGDIKQGLRDARNSKSPIQMEGPDGSIMTGYISSLVEQMLGGDYDDREGGTPSLEYNVRVTFVELS